MTQACRKCAGPVIQSYVTVEGVSILQCGNGHMWLEHVEYEEKPKTQEGGEVTAVGNAVIYAQGDRIIFELPHLGRVELTPEQAEKVSVNMKLAAQIVRQDRPKKLVLVGS